jgi:hypothetical protein
LPQVARMVEPGTISEINKISIRLSAAFAIIGIGLMYLYIVARDSLRQREREVNRVRSP